MSVLLFDANVPNVVQRVAGCSSDIHLFLNSPVAFAENPDTITPEVRNFPGVLGVDQVDDMTFRVLRGLDQMALLAAQIHPLWSTDGIEPGQPYPTVWDEPADGLPKAAGSPVCAAVNLSLVPVGAELLPTRPTDPVNHLTRFLSGMTVPVAAAGNAYDGTQEFETVSPWAEPDWVLSVGATVDEGATVVAEYSSRASEFNPSVGPDILAWGASALDRSVIGTSFAAPRVAYMIALCRSWLHQLQANCFRITRQSYGVPLIGVGLVDKGVRLRAPDTTMFDALPVMRIDADAETAVIEGLIERNLLPSEPVKSRRLLMAAAEHHGREDLTNTPCISLSSLLEFLDAMTVPRLLTAIGETDCPESITRGSTQIFPPGTADRLHTYLSSVVPIWSWDIETSLTARTFG